MVTFDLFQDGATFLTRLRSDTIDVSSYAPPFSLLAASPAHPYPACMKERA